MKNGPYEKILKDLEHEEVVRALHSLYKDDCYYYHFTKNKYYDELLHAMEHFGIAFIASDGRVLLTSFGETLLFKLFALGYS